MAETPLGPAACGGVGCPRVLTVETGVRFGICERLGMSESALSYWSDGMGCVSPRSLYMGFGSAVGPV